MARAMRDKSPFPMSPMSPMSLMSSSLMSLPRWTPGLLVGWMNIRTLTDQLSWPQPQTMTNKMNQLMEAELGQEIEGQVRFPIIPCFWTRRNVL